VSLDLSDTGETLALPLVDLLPCPFSATAAGLSAVVVAPTSKGGAGRARSELVERRTPLSRRRLRCGGGTRLNFMRCTAQHWQQVGLVGSRVLGGVAALGPCGSESGSRGSGPGWWRWGGSGFPWRMQRSVVRSISKVKLPWRWCLVQRQ
jgi:hypothetical protein